jgi:hypothetical protein
MPEWSNGPAWKAGVGKTLPGVRIPLSPPSAAVSNFETVARCLAAEPASLGGGPKIYEKRRGERMRTRVRRSEHRERRWGSRMGDRALGKQGNLPQPIPLPRRRARSEAGLLTYEKKRKVASPDPKLARKWNFEDSESYALRLYSQIRKVSRPLLHRIYLRLKYTV